MFEEFDVVRLKKNDSLGVIVEIHSICGNIELCDVEFCSSDGTRIIACHPSELERS